jgi:N-glycosidase YbiA
MNVINFYSTKDNKYGVFSNFSRHTIKLDDKIWPTSEHYFQAMKFENNEVIIEQIRTATTPAEAARLGRDRSVPIRNDWESVKDYAMRTAVWAKITQYPELKELLLSTGNDMLVEHTKNDSYWGDGGDGTGINMLGIILMEVRNKLRSNREYF